MTRSLAFFRARRWLHVFASKSGWLIVPFTSVVIGQSNNFGLAFMTFNCVKIAIIFNRDTKKVTAVLKNEPVLPLLSGKSV